MADISSAATALQTLTNVILVSPSQNNGLKASQSLVMVNGKPTVVNPDDDNFIFQYEGEQKISLKSDITDHYAEDNKSLQDQIALPPLQYSTQGFIGELSDAPTGLLIPLKAIANKLTTIGAYVPSISTSALIAYNQAFQANQIATNLLQTANNTISTIASFVGGGNGSDNIIGTGIFGTVQTKQQVAFQRLYQYYLNRTLFTVQTPWCTLVNMAIESLVALQDAESVSVTDFQVNFKAMRFAQELTVSLTESFSTDTRGAAQAAKLINNGGSAGGPVTPFPGGVLKVSSIA